MKEKEKLSTVRALGRASKGEGGSHNEDKCMMK